MLTALAYSLLLPMWEGFDEPFHYAYAQWLAVERRWPELGRTPVSKEVWRSLSLVPGSHVVRRNLPFITTFDRYFTLLPAERAASAAELRAIPRELRAAPAPSTLNYEAQQPPLAYLALALVDVLPTALPWRLLMARLFCAVVGGGLQLWLSLRLARALGLDGLRQAMVLFLLIGTQMFHAAFSRVSNDWLAVPLSTLVVLCAVRLYADPRPVRAGAMGVALALGLLTKAYFLVWCGFGAGLMLWLLLQRRAGARCLAAMLVGVLPAIPWYLRNVALYGNVTGTIQACAGVGFTDALRAALEIPWPRTLMAMARGALWTGNNSFTSFSALTLNILLLAGAVSAVWALRRRRMWLPAAAVLVFGASLVYANAMFYAQARSSFYTATPWYAQAMAAPLACLSAAGAMTVGRWMAALLVVLSSYLPAATFWLKLFPLYGGCPGGRMNAAALAECYGGEWQDGLDAVAVGDAGCVVWLGVMASVAAPACGAFLVREIFRVRGEP